MALWDNGSIDYANTQTQDKAMSATNLFEKAKATEVEKPKSKGKAKPGLNPKFRFKKKKR